jgi:cephalosporin-C deacetylase
VTRFAHQYPFDPSYGYSLADLLSAPKSAAPADFRTFWQERYRKTLAFSPRHTLTPCGKQAGFLVYNLSYQSTANFMIHGWLLVPEQEPVKQGIVVGHGYGGRDQPDYHLTIPNTAFLFPCFRGLGLSRCAGVPENPEQHVVFGIENPQNYILGGCVEDLWLAVSVLINIFPQTSDHIGYMGISFGGGIGALALPWDRRIKRGHFNVPTFGNQPLRLSLPTTGSAAALKRHSEQFSHVFATLAYYDSSVSAGYAIQAVHFALAMFDPVVAPPGQFAIYNAWMAKKSLFILEAGHFAYPNQAAQEQKLLLELKKFFREISL